MGKQISLVKFVGKLDNVVGYVNRNGEAIIRSKRENPYNPQTEAQMKQRVSFATANALAAIVKLGAIGFAPYAKQQGMSVRNALTRQNLRNGAVTAGMSGGQMVGEIEWSDVELSRGVTASVRFATAQSAAPGQVSVGYTPTGAATSDPDDVVLVVVSEAMRQCVVQRTPFSRTTPTAKVDLDPVWSGEEVHVYAYTLSFGEDEETRARVYTMWDGGSIEAYAQFIQLLGNAEFSVSNYCGDVTIG
jgi:hypothetical protein